MAEKIALSVLRSCVFAHSVSLPSWDDLLHILRGDCAYQVGSFITFQNNYEDQLNYGITYVPSGDYSSSLAYCASS